ATVRFGDGMDGSRAAIGAESVALRYREGITKAGDASLADKVVTLHSAWTPGEPVWSGTVDGKPVAVQVRPAANGFALAFRGAQVMAWVYTEGEAAYARLMPVKAAADTGKSLLCPMPGVVRAIAVAEGQEVKA